MKPHSPRRFGLGAKVEVQHGTRWLLATVIGNTPQHVRVRYDADDTARLVPGGPEVRITRGTRKLVKPEQVRPVSPIGLAFGQPSRTAAAESSAGKEGLEQIRGHRITQAFIDEPVREENGLETLGEGLGAALVVATVAAAVGDLVGGLSDAFGGSDSSDSGGSFDGGGGGDFGGGGSSGDW